MRNIFSGSFNQVEDAVSESFAKNKAGGMEEFSIGRIILLFIFLMGGFYAAYGFSIWMGNNLDTGTIPLDINNEYIPFLSNIWYPTVQSVLILISIVSIIYLRKKNNVKAFYISNTLLTIYLLLFLLLLFKITQLLVYSFPLRMVYTVIFIFCFVYTFVQSYQNAKEMVSGERKKRSAIVEWLSRNRKTVLSVLIGVGGLSYFAKTIFPSAGDMETRLIGALIDFGPLFVSLTLLLFMYFNGVVIRSYYLNKYSEEFRIKFGVDKKDWYGEKYVDKHSSDLQKYES